MRELAILEAIRRRAARPPARELLLGIGDDCAIYRPRGSREDLLFTTDLLLEDVHFRRATHPPEAIGHKALARGLSDIAAMGGEPRFCLVSLAVPDVAQALLPAQRGADNLVCRADTPVGARWDRPPGLSVSRGAFDPAAPTLLSAQFISRFYTGLLRLARQTGVALAGGDLARASQIACDIVVAGAVPRGQALRRDRAKAGDAIYVSGALGGSALGLERGPGKTNAWARHLRPQPRLALGTLLRERLGASSAMDSSDGLSLDLHRLALASGLEAHIEAPPRFPGASIDQALHGGEDYELLFTLRPAVQVPSVLAGVAITRIGFMRKGQPGAVYMSGQPLPALGYDHFRATPTQK